MRQQEARLEMKTKVSCSALGFTVCVVWVPFDLGLEGEEEEQEERDATRLKGPCRCNTLAALSADAA